jgi:alcohol-forming fatty acyl-CoA reductase
MSEADKERFKFNIADLEWINFLEDYYLGLRNYILKDEMENVPVAMKRYDR